MATYFVPGTQLTDLDRTILADSVQRYGYSVDTGDVGVEVRYPVEDKHLVISYITSQLHKFIMLRQDVTNYVNTRYYDCSEKFCARKIVEVENRIKRAQEIIDAINNSL